MVGDSLNGIMTLEDLAAELEQAASDSDDTSPFRTAWISIHDHDLASPNSIPERLLAFLSSPYAEHVVPRPRTWTQIDLSTTRTTLAGLLLLGVCCEPPTFHSRFVDDLLRHFTSYFATDDGVFHVGWGCPERGMALVSPTKSALIWFFGYD
jgi:hypothetical protein